MFERPFGLLRLLSSQLEEQPKESELDSELDQALRDVARLIALWDVLSQELYDLELRTESGKWLSPPTARDLCMQNADRMIAFAYHLSCYGGGEILKIIEYEKSARENSKEE